MLFANGDPTILILVAVLLIAGVELLMRYTGLVHQRSQIIVAANRLAAALAGLVAVGFFLSLSNPSFGDAIGGLVMGALVAVCLWPVLYLAAAGGFVLWRFVLGDLWRLMLGGVHSVASLLRSPVPAPRTVSEAELERRRAEQARRVEEERVRQERAQAVRENARMECQLYLDRNREQLEPNFNQERLDAYFASYLTDRQPLDVVQRRGQQLLLMMKDYVESRDDDSPFDSLASIASHFEGIRREIEEQTSYDIATKESLIVAINLQEEEAVRRFLQQ